MMDEFLDARREYESEQPKTMEYISLEQGKQDSLDPFHLSSHYSQISRETNKIFEKSETIESDSSTMIDKFTKSLYDNPNVYDGNNVIHECVFEDSEQSVTGCSSTSLSNKNSDIQLKRKGSHQRLKLNNHKRIKITCKDKESFKMAQNQRKLDPMFLMIAVPKISKRSKLAEICTKTKKISKHNSQNSFGFQRWEGINEMPITEKFEPECKVNGKEYSQCEQTLLDLEDVQPSSEIEFSGDWISNFDCIKFEINKLTYDEFEESISQMRVPQQKINDINIRASRSVPRSQNRSFQPTNDISLIKQNSNEEEVKIETISRFKAKLWTYKVLDKSEKMEMKYNLPCFEKFVELVSLYGNSDPYEDDKISHASIPTPNIKYEKVYSDIAARHKGLADMIELVTHPSVKNRSIGLHFK